MALIPAHTFRHSFRIRRVLLFAVGLLLPLAAPAPADPVSIAQGDLRAEFDIYNGLMPGNGLRLTYRGLPLLTRTTVNVFSPDWRSGYFNLARIRPQIQRAAVPDGKRLLLTAANDAFTLAYTVELQEGNRVVLDLQGTLLKETPAVLEYAVGYLYAPLLAGQPYQAETKEGSRQGTLPFSAIADRLPEALLLPPFHTLAVDSRLGRLTVAAETTDEPLDLFDARKMPASWLQANPIFWLGYRMTPLQVGQTFHSRVTLSLEPTPSAALPAHPVAPATALPIQEAAAVTFPGTADGKIIPAPQQQSSGRGSFTLDARTRIRVDGSAAAQRAARELQTRLRDDYNLQIPVAPAMEGDDERRGILIGLGQTPWLRRQMAESRISPVTHPEGYALQITGNRILLAGADARGTLYGVFTLLQMLRRAPDSRSLNIPASTVRDWPALPVRAVHLLTDNWSVFLHRDLIRRVLAPHKINTIILECEYVKWESHPELNVEWGMPKAEARALLALARDYDIEVIPLVQTLGHAGWMFQNNQHLDLAEDPQAKYAYCPSNPKTYALLFDILNEALELFDHPRILHIGHDEYRHRGKFAQEGPCAGKDPADLFLADTIKLHDFLAAHGTRTMMWGDMILAPGEAADAAHARSEAEAQRLRAQLPKDILIADWHYVPAETYPSLKILRDAGFGVWAATWNHPQNIQGFARTAARDGAGGLIQTTWTGYQGNMTALRSWFPQLWAYLAAAEYAWNPEHTPLAEAVAAAPGRFIACWDGPLQAALPRPGFTVDLAPLANLPWNDDAQRQGWLGFGPEHDLGALRAGLQRLGNYTFLLPENRKAIGLAGPLHLAHYPEQARIPIGRRAAGFVFLLTAGWESAEGQPVGNITFRYRDGAILPVELRYGWNIRAVHDPRTAFLAPTVWEGKTAAGDPLFLRALPLANPLPRKEIESVEIATDGGEAAPILLALSGIN